jgi:hypothetical protein
VGGTAGAVAAPVVPELAERPMTQTQATTTSAITPARIAARLRGGRITIAVATNARRPAAQAPREYANTRETVNRTVAAPCASALRAVAARTARTRVSGTTSSRNAANGFRQ